MNPLFSDVKDKTLRKLERMSTSSRGPLREFAEKKDYMPSVQILYTDEKGREMTTKEAYRHMSWK